MGKSGRPPREISDTGTIVCNSCGCEKHFSKYSKSSRYRCGRDMVCRLCYKEYREKNKERFRLRHRKYLGKMKEYWAKNREAIAKYRRDRYANDESVRLTILSQGHARRAKSKMTADGSVTAEFIMDKLSKQGGKCAISGQSLDNVYHIDHIIPLCKGGKHTAENIQLLSPSVNMSKGAKIWQGQASIEKNTATA